MGPSLIVADVQATPAAGSTTSLTDFGVAVDIGYQMLVAERWTVALGVGAEYVFTSKSLPDQQWPANLYANAGFHPRPLVALGYRILSRQTGSDEPTETPDRCAESN